MIKETNSTQFISDVLNNELPSLVLFFHDEKIEEMVKIKKSLEPLLKKRPLLKVFELNLDKEENQAFADALGIDKTPYLAFYKEWNFNRYKNTKFSPKELEKFLGGEKFFQEKKPTKKM